MPRSPVEGSNDLLSGGQLGDPREDHVEAVGVGAGHQVGHGVGDHGELIASLVGGAGSRLDPDAGRNPGEDNPGDPSAAQLQVELRSVEGIPSPLGDDQVVATDLQLGAQLRPVRPPVGRRPARRRARPEDVSAVGGQGDPDGHDGEVVRPEGACQASGPVNDLVGRVHRRHGGDATLQVNEDEGSGGVQDCRHGHNYPARRMTRAQADRSALIATALRLSWLSVVWAALSGTASLTLGVLDHSLAITGVGLNLLGDLAGSLALIWRFGHERGRLHGAETAERVARLVVGTSLTVVAAFLAVQSVRRLADGTGPAADVGPILVAAASVVVLPPLARAKRGVGTALSSHALRGDGTLSGVGAAVALVALAGLLVNRTLGWWWADPAAAFVVAVVAAVEAREVFAAGP